MAAIMYLFGSHGSEGDAGDVVCLGKREMNTGEPVRAFIKLLRDVADEMEENINVDEEFVSIIMRNQEGFPNA
jgi:hypothetical protein